MYRQTAYRMFDGGVKPPSHDTYTRNFMEYWRTMYRIGVPDHHALYFPTRDAVLQIYIVNCAAIRQPVNTWTTIRGKLRAIDYAAQRAGKHQEWANNPALFALCQYAKQRNKGQGSDTIPIGARIVINIFEYVLATKVYHELDMTPDERMLRRQRLTFQKIWTDPERLKWYI